MKTGFKLSTFNQLHLCCSQCLKDSPRPVWVLQRSPFLSSRPQRGERHLQTSRSTARAETEAASQFPYILMWSSQGQTFLCSLLFFIVIVSETRNATFNGSAQKLPESERQQEAFLAWTCWKCGLEWSYGFKTHSPESRTILLPLLGNTALHNYDHTDELPVSMTILNMLQFQPF